jgi:hypothetical protein
VAAKKAAALRAARTASKGSGAMRPEVRARGERPDGRWRPARAALGRAPAGAPGGCVRAKALSPSAYAALFLNGKACRTSRKHVKTLQEL